jgi:hypothetical protein
MPLDQFSLPRKRSAVGAGVAPPLRALDDKVEAGFEIAARLAVETAASTRRGGAPGGSMRPEPGALPDIVPYAVPFTSLIEVIRGIALTGDGITAYGQQVVVSVA